MRGWGLLANGRGGRTGHDFPAGAGSGSVPSDDFLGSSQGGGGDSENRGLCGVLSMGKKKAYKPAPPDGWTKLSNAILEDDRIKDQHVRVYAAIRSIAGENGTCWATAENIGKRAGGKGKRAVQSIAGDLVALGLIVIEPRPDLTTGRQYRIVDAPLVDSRREIHQGVAQDSAQGGRRISRGVAQDSAPYLRTHEEEQRSNTPPLSSLPSGDRSNKRVRRDDRAKERKPGTRIYAKHRFVPLAEDRYPPSEDELARARTRQAKGKAGKSREAAEIRAIESARHSSFIERWLNDCGNVDELSWRVACLFGDMRNVEYYAEVFTEEISRTASISDFEYWNLISTVWHRYELGEIRCPGAYYERAVDTAKRSRVSSTGEGP